MLSLTQGKAFRGETPREGDATAPRRPFISTVASARWVPGESADQPSRFNGLRDSWFPAFLINAYYPRLKITEATPNR